MGLPRPNATRASTTYGHCRKGNTDPRALGCVCVCSLSTVIDGCVCSLHLLCLYVGCVEERRGACAVQAHGALPCALPGQRPVGAEGVPTWRGSIGAWAPTAPWGWPGRAHWQYGALTGHAPYSQGMGSPCGVIDHLHRVSLRWEARSVTKMSTEGLSHARGAWQARPHAPESGETSCYRVPPTLQWPPGTLPREPCHGRNSVEIMGF